MKATPIQILASLIALTALASCSAFTAPADPVTGIRLDAPADWDGTPNPLDTPATTVKRPESMGRFGPHSEFYP